MKITISGPTLFFIGLLLLFAVATHARGIPPKAPPSTEFTMPEGAVPVDAKTVQKFLQLTVAYSRYKYPWFSQPRAYTLPVAWFIESCGGYECGRMASTIMTGSAVILIRADLPPEVFEEFLVHELTHWLQNRADWTARDCNNWTAREIEAYAVQNTFRTIYQQRWAKFWTPEYICVADRGHH